MIRPMTKGLLRKLLMASDLPDNAPIFTKCCTDSAYHPTTMLFESDTDFLMMADVEEIREDDEEPG